MAASDDAKEMSDSGDISTQENVSARGSQASARQQSRQQVRHRASVACASCRDRRIRCVVPQGQNDCNQCRRAGTECVIKNDDERRRPVSKAYMSSLSERIVLLEGMLKDKGVVPPPACHPPKTKHEGVQNTSDGQQQKPTPSTERAVSQQRALSNNTDINNAIASPSCGVPSPPDSSNGINRVDGDPEDVHMTGSQVFYALPKEDSPFSMLDPKQEDIVHRLLSTAGNLSFDQLSGTPRFFGPTANSHVYAEIPNQYDAREPPEQVRRAERIIRSLSSESYDYLMNHFWRYYNSVIPVIDRTAFESDRESQNPKFYSSFLHISILAMGYRGCDMGRDDMKRISLGNRESTLHREAKYMLDIELERPGGIPSVQALLLLGDLECGVGRDNTGWMYAGMANRLAFDIGLHLDCDFNGMPEQEVYIRRMVMRACVIYDKYWALFLGRPTSIKSQDLGMELISDKFSMLHPDLQKSTEKDISMEVYEQLIELMELAGRIVETRDHHVMRKKQRNNPDISNNIFAMSEAEDNAYLHVVNLDRQLQNWYRRLPDHLAWKPSNIKTAPYSFFLLHQQYHVSMILLHRPWAKYNSISGDGSSTGSHPTPSSGHIPIGTESAPNHPGLTIQEHSIGMGDPHSMVHDSRASLSRSICTQQAIRVARIFWQYRQRFDGRKIFVTGIQHAGTAVLALIAALAYQPNEADRRTYMGYLEILSCALGDMSNTYHPAARMDDLLRAVMSQIHLGPGETAQAMAQQQTFFPYGLPGVTGMSGGSGSDVSVPLVPSRRDATDAGIIQQHQPLKKMRGINSRRASEFARPPPPFFPGNTAQHTPPQSTHDQQHMFGSGLHQRQNSQVDSMLFSLGVTDGSSIDLDFLGPAVDMDSTEEHGGPASDLNLVTPSSETWGYGSIHSDHHSSHQSGGDQPEFRPGPAGLSASSVLGQSSAISTGLMSGTSFGLSRGESDAVEERSADASGMGSSDAALDGLSPVNLSGLVRSVEDSTAGQDQDGADGGRHRDLDFFSFH